MPIQAQTTSGGGESLPGLKFPEVGTEVMYRLAHAAVIDKTVFGSNPPRVETWDDGSPKKQLKLTGILMTPGFRAVKQPDDSYLYEPIPAGTAIVDVISGHNRFTEDAHRQSWGQAENLYGGAPMIGDVVHTIRGEDE